MLITTITTIQPPTSCATKLVRHLCQAGAHLVVAGDTKGPENYAATGTEDWPVTFLSIADQTGSGFTLPNQLPTKHYARKNIAYLEAIRRGATCIYETDDDNTPNEEWAVREEMVEGHMIEKSGNLRWVNVYKFFSTENIWPRGLPLNEIHTPLPPTDHSHRTSGTRAPIQQGLVDGSPDVDAIWRLTQDRQFRFERKDSIVLGPGNWCPFNTQSTWWWPVAYPLLYIPSYCSFRMCDIWKSFVAQRCLWAMDLGVAFHAPEVDQERNEHDLMVDFKDEIAGYQENARIAHLLDELDLSANEDDVGANLRRCYAHLVENQIFPAKELDLVDLWLQDLYTLGRSCAN